MVALGELGGSGGVWWALVAFDKLYISFSSNFDFSWGLAGFWWA